jgi:transcriptional regulator with XRE-family HTH domain
MPHRFGLVAPDVLARRIRMIMGDQKLSRKRLAMEAGISRPSLANKLDAQVSFTYDELVRIVEVLGVSWDALLSEGGDNPLDDALRAYGPRGLSQFEPHRERRL